MAMRRVTPRPPDPRNQRIPCSASAVVRDEEGLPVLDADGRKQYRPCRGWARKGQKVCRAHGGNTPQALVAAEEQLKRARDPLMAEMIDIALDRRLPPADRTRALAWLLERTGFKAGVEISHTLPAWQEMLRELFERGDDAEERPALPATPTRDPEVADTVRRLDEILGQPRRGAPTAPAVIDAEVITVSGVEGPPPHHNRWHEGGAEFGTPLRRTARRR